MNQKNLKTLFNENYNYFIKSTSKLELSFHKSKKIEIKTINALKETELETLETLLSRFSRTTDILINKLLRSLDLLEQEDVSRKLDTVIRAEKRRFVENYNDLISLKDLRNELSHEYIEDELIDKFKEVIDKVPVILSVKEKIVIYSNKFKYI